MLAERLKVIRVCITSSSSKINGLAGTKHRAVSTGSRNPSYSDKNIDFVHDLSSETSEIPPAAVSRSPDSLRDMAYI
jgi:hypothetical protein